MNLKTKYLGFDLPNPLVVGASPLTENLDTVRKLEDAGAAAIVIYSLFEEQIIHEQKGIEKYIDQYGESFAEAMSYFPQAEFNNSTDKYLEQIHKIKKCVRCPVIASINGVHEGTWVDYAKLMQQAGADAIELNLYFNPMVSSQTSSDIEGSAINVVKKVREAINIPLAVKIAPFFSVLPNFIDQIEKAGANAIVMFNRLFQPDIDIENLEAVPRLRFSDPSELFLRLRWVAATYKRTRMNIALTGGVMNMHDIVKSIMAGADCVQLVSCLLQQGPHYLHEIITQLEGWMEIKEYASLGQMKGSMSYASVPNPDALERANYVKILHSWNA